MQAEECPLLSHIYLCPQCSRTTAKLSSMVHTQESTQVTNFGLTSRSTTIQTRAGSVQIICPRSGCRVQSQHHAIVCSAATKHARKAPTSIRSPPAHSLHAGGTATRKHLYGLMYHYALLQRQSKVFGLSARQRSSGNACQWLAEGIRQCPGWRPNSEPEPAAISVCCPI